MGGEGAKSKPRLSTSVAYVARQVLGTWNDHATLPPGPLRDPALVLVPGPCPGWTSLCSCSWYLVPAADRRRCQALLPVRIENLVDPMYRALQVQAGGAGRPGGGGGGGVA